MRKTSMFSKDYNRVMRRKKKTRMIISTTVVIVFTTVGLILASDIGSGDFLIGNEGNEVENVGIEIEKDNNIDDISENENQSELLEIKFNINGEEIVFNCSSENGLITFKELKEDSSEIYYTLNNKKDSVVIIDNNQNMYIGKVDGVITDITLKEYISTSGQKFQKDMILEMYEGYIWNSNATFINDEKIAYISNVPYFGTGVSKYIATIDIVSNERATLWETKGDEIILGSVTDKGLEVEVDGNIKNIK